MRVQVNAPARVSAPVCMSDVSRRGALAGAAAAAFGALPAFAEGEFKLKKGRAFHYIENNLTLSFSLK